jgi:3-oxoacyl-[acyl-carrier-protein] synthase-3
VVAPASPGAPPDIDVLQIYASGPVSQVNSIIWPNPEFDNNITVYGPEVRALAGRYLVQMMGELRELPPPEDGSGSLLDSIDLVVPHQANKTMVTELAVKAGLTPDRLYFNIERVGNVSAASIPLASTTPSGRASSIGRCACSRPGSAPEPWAATPCSASIPPSWSPSGPGRARRPR